MLKGSGGGDPPPLRRPRTCSPPDRMTQLRFAIRGLFPGASPPLPAQPSHLMARLHRHAITSTAGVTNTVRAPPASRLPASILAVLAGMRVHTAVSWNRPLSRLTGHDWTEYVALRIRRSDS